jgi:hypothetical protein
MGTTTATLRPLAAPPTHRRAPVRWQSELSDAVVGDYTSCIAERRLAAHGADKDSGRLCHWPICQSCVRLIDWPMTG